MPGRKKTGSRYKFEHSKAVKKCWPVCGPWITSVKPSEKKTTFSLPPLEQIDVFGNRRPGTQQRKNRASLKRFYSEKILSLPTLPEVEESVKDTKVEKTRIGIPDKGKDSHKPISRNYSMSSVKSYSDDDNLCESVTWKYLEKVCKYNGSQALNLRNHGLTAEWGPSLYDFLSDQSHLISVDLANNDLNADGIDYVCSALQRDKNLTTLDVSSNDIGLFGANAVADLLSSSSCQLRTLSLGSNNLTDLDIESFIIAIRGNEILTQLDLRCNRFQDSTAQHIKEVLTQNSTLKTLDISWNLFSADGIVKIFEGLQKNKTLSGLSLVGCRIVDDLVEQFTDICMSNKSLEHLDFSENAITDTGLQILCRFISSNEQLKSLKLGSNCITSDGAVYLLDSLSAYKMSKLMLVDLSGTYGDHYLRASFERLKNTRKQFALTGLVGTSRNYGITVGNALESYLKRNHLNRGPSAN